MPSKQRWLSTLGALDVFTTMEAFEEISGITIELSLTLYDSSSRRGPWIMAVAYTRPAAGVGRALLGSAQLKCSTTEFGSLDVAAFRVLYVLDTQLDALRDTADKPKSAAPGAL